MTFHSSVPVSGLLWINPRGRLAVHLTDYAVFFSFILLGILGTFSTTETGGRLGCNHRMSLEFLAIRWHKS